MEASFWHKKWDDNEIGFHTPEANPLLVKHFHSLTLAPDNRIFIPLCGKTLDIGWLLAQDFRIVGAELSPIAIEQLFKELGFEPEINTVGPFTHYSATNIDIFVGDVFQLSTDILGSVDAIYDRAALVALPEAMRHQYTALLIALSKKSPQLLISFDYDQEEMAGPPFSISHAEINSHYSNSYSIELLESANVEGGLKGQCEAQENVWLLKP